MVLDWYDQAIALLSVESDHSADTELSRKPQVVRRSRGFSNRRFIQVALITTFSLSTTHSSEQRLEAEHDQHQRTF